MTVPTCKPQSASLTQFYREIHLWILLGCPDHDLFEIDRGLCGNLYNWLMSDSLIRTVEVEGIVQEMVDQFEEAKLSVSYPFDLSRLDYRYCANNGLHYKNPKRLAWVESHRFM